jgi:hypothetical protein
MMVWFSSLISSLLLLVKRFQSGDGLIGDDGMAARAYPEHWKGDNGLYCAGLIRRGIYGSYEDAELIAGDISGLLQPHQQAQGNGATTHSNGSK